MPIPLIVWGAGLGATALAGLIKSGNAVKRISLAKKRYENRRLNYEAFIREYGCRHKYTSEKFDELGKVRLEAIVVLGEVVKFLEKAK